MDDDIDDELTEELVDGVDEEEAAVPEIIYEVVEDDDAGESGEYFDDEDLTSPSAIAAQVLKQKGKDDRAFYDNMAKESDTKRHELESSIAASSLYLNDAKAKLAKKERELKDLMRRIAEEKERQTMLEQKAYRGRALAEEDAKLRNTETKEESLGILRDNPLTKDEKRELSESLADTERKAQVLVGNMKGLQPEKAKLEAEITAMKSAINERERKLSLERHNLLRMS